MLQEVVEYKPEDLDKMSFEDYCRTIFDPKTAASKPEALKGYIALSPTQYILGPASASYLAELGAMVIKIEMPRLGEPMRHTTPYNEPYLYPVSRWVPDRGTGMGFMGANPNEYFISLDFRKPEAVEIMHSLMRKADMMLWNFRPGTFARWGFGYDAAQEVNPRLVQTWMGGFGGWGPGRKRASYDILGQAQGGCFSMTGIPRKYGGTPSKHTIWLADYWGGQMGSSAALASIYWREFVSGEGNYIEYSQVHGVTRQMESALPLWGRFGLVTQRWGNWDRNLCVHGIIQCGKSSYPDSEIPLEQEVGYILVSAYTDEDFKKLCDIMGRPDLAEQYATHDDRIEAAAQEALYPEIEAWAADKSKEDVYRILTEENDINSQPVWSNKEVANNPHYLERGEIVWMDDPTFGELCHQGPLSMLSDTPRRMRWSMKPVGADNEFIYSQLLGYSQGEIRDFEERAVI